MGFDTARSNGMQIPVSDTRAYKQFGNSVVVPVIEDIAHYMRPFILEILDRQEDLSQTAAE
jgi:DNA (cytosine-5)-methyltransferase 1